ncbi:MAG TPA: hypothetical protein VK552_00340, partial [Reyranella sp.]|nr:hypothetical protein [Reyranella sp.]
MMAIFFADLGALLSADFRLFRLGFTQGAADPHPELRHDGARNGRAVATHAVGQWAIAGRQQRLTRLDAVSHPDAAWCRPETSGPSCAPDPGSRMVMLTDASRQVS